MESGYEVVWASYALSELATTLSYLEQHWTRNELTRFVQALDHTIDLISRYPQLYPESDYKKGVRKAVVDGNNALYYRVEGAQVQILSVFATKKNPSARP